MLRTIVTPIDGSRHAQLALELASDLAARYQARLVILNVGVGDENLPEDLFNTASQELLQLDRDGKDVGIPAHRSHYLRVVGYIGQRLLSDARQVAEKTGVKEVDTVTLLGAAGEQIIQHARDVSADLIVMGSRGFSKLKGLVLGSVSQNVFQFSHCPCLTVHHKGDDDSSRLEIERILVPTDGSEPAEKAVALASDIAGKIGAGIVFQYVMWRGPLLEDFRSVIDMEALSQTARDELDPAQHPIAERAGSVFFPPVVSKETRIEIGQQILDRSRQVAEGKGVADVELVLLDGDPARKIVQVAKNKKVDLIVMGSRGLGAAEGMLYGSVSYKVSHVAPASCMVVR